MTEGELRDFVRARLAPQKCPRIWRFADDLPLTASGKVQKHLLRREFVDTDRSEAGR